MKPAANTFRGTTVRTCLFLPDGTMIWREWTRATASADARLQCHFASLDDDE